MKTVFTRPHEIRYISHRGFMPLAPENSLPSFEYAGMLGQWAIETDVRVTRDGALVCCHDANVLRMFGKSGLVEEMTLKEISCLRYCSGNRLECLTDEQRRMPLFSEYLEVCRRFGSIPFIELKTPDVERVLNAVRHAGFEDNEVVMSATPVKWLYDTRRYTKEMFIHWIFAEEEKLADYAALGNAGVSLNIPDSFACPKEKINAAHELGLRICLRAGDSMESVCHMRDLGLDYIPSNCMHLPMDAKKEA